MCAAMAADKYSPGRGPEMDERRANKERLSEEHLESSPEVDRALYKHTIMTIIIKTLLLYNYCYSVPL